MQLLPAALRAHLPLLYSGESSEDPIVQAKFFCPWANHLWFATDGAEYHRDFIFFGYVIGHEEKWGYFALSELEAIQGPEGKTVERDLAFTPAPFSQVMEQFRRDRGG